MSSRKYIRVRRFLIKVRDLLLSQPYSYLLTKERYKEQRIKLFNQKIKIPDGPSFTYMYNEIFKQEIYKFRTDTSSPYIIDAGANIGLSVLYFKQLYPSANIVAFEPDPKIFEYLKNIVDKFSLQNVQLIKKGVWNKEDVLHFTSEGADGGKLSDSKDSKGIEVQLTPLKPYLNKKVDFLKIDIEGAEDTVIEDVKDLLTNVENIFIEYHSVIGKEQKLNEILQSLKNAGFRTYINSPGFMSNQPFIDIKVENDMDMQLNIYGYRENNG